MDFPGFVKEHPAISIVLLLAVVAGLGVTAVFYSQSTFVDDSSGAPCSWQKAPNESEQDFRDYVQSQGGTLPESTNFTNRNGNLYFKTPCGTVGGGTSQ